MKHHQINENKKSNKLLTSLMWYLIWIIVYSLFYLVFSFLLNEMIGSYHFYQVKFISILILGLCFSVGSRIVHSLIHNNTIYLGTDVFISWTFTYGLSIWFFEFLRDLAIEKLNPSFLADGIFSALFIGLGVFLSIKLIKRIEFGMGINKPRFLRAPSQIISGIMLFVIGVLIFRFSTIIFVDWLLWPEGVAWSWFFGLIFIIGGLLTIIAWWRNNVLQHRVGIKFGNW